MLTTALIGLFGVSYVLVMVMFGHAVVAAYKHTHAGPEQSMGPRQVVLKQPLDYVVYEKAIVWEELV